MSICNYNINVGKSHFFSHLELLSRLRRPNLQICCFFFICSFVQNIITQRQQFSQLLQYHFESKQNSIKWTIWHWIFQFRWQIANTHISTETKKFIYQSQHWTASYETSYTVLVVVVVVVDQCERHEIHNTQRWTSHRRSTVYRGIELVGFQFWIGYNSLTQRMPSEYMSQSDWR